MCASDEETQDESGFRIRRFDDTEEDKNYPSGAECSFVMGIPANIDDICFHSHRPLQIWTRPYPGEEQDEWSAPYGRGPKSLENFNLKAGFVYEIALSEEEHVTVNMATRERVPPAASKTVGLKFYERELPEGEIREAWSEGKDGN